MRRDEGGASLVEFVLTLGVVCLLLFALVELGFMLNAKLVMVSAAREGARRAAVEGGATGQVLERIEHQLRMGRIDPRHVRVDITPRTASYGTSIRVKLEYPYRVMIPMVRALVGEEVPIGAEMISRSEKVR